MNRFYDFSNNDNDDISKAVKNAYRQMCELFVMLSEKFEFSKHIGEGDIDFEDMFKADVFDYLAYLAASDGVLSLADVTFINEVLGLKFNPGILDRKIKDRNIYSKEFENSVPMSFKLMIAIDNVIDNMDDKPDNMVCDGYKFMLVLLTKHLIAKNGRSMDDAMPTEKENIVIYFSTLQDYMDTHLERYNMDLVVNYKK